MKAFILLVLFTGAIFAQTTPDFVLELFRHGARAPNKNKIDSTWKSVGYGELTSVGIRQQYVLGLILKERYSKLLLPYNPSQIYAYSSDANRTLMSLATQLSAIYEGAGPSIPDGLSADLEVPPFDSSENADVTASINYNTAGLNSFQPVPIHSNNETNDYLLESYLNCASLQYLYLAQVNDNVTQALYAELSETVTFFKSKGYTVATLKDLFYIADAAISNNNYGKSLPGNILSTSQTYKDLKIAFQFYEIYSNLAQTVQRRVLAAPMLSQLQSYIEGTRKNTNPIKFVFWSAHETAMAVALAALNISNPECLVANWRSDRANQPIPYPGCIYPEFSSSLIFEYYNTASPYVITKYNGVDLDLCSNNKICTLTQFEDLIYSATGGVDFNGYYNICSIATTTNTTSTTSTVNAATMTNTTIETQVIVSKGRPMTAVIVLGIIVGVLAFAVVVLSTLLIRKERKRIPAKSYTVEEKV